MSFSYSRVQTATTPDFWRSPVGRAERIIEVFPEEGYVPDAVMPIPLPSTSSDVLSRPP